MWSLQQAGISMEDAMLKAMLQIMCYKCSSTVAVAKLSTSYLEEAKSATTTCDAHLVPRAVLATPSACCSTSSARRSPTSHEQEPPRHLGLRKLNETAESVEGTYMCGRSCPDRAAQPKLAACGQEGADGRVIARDSRRGGRRPIVESEGVGEVGARRRTPRATRRIKKDCEAELCVAEAIPSLWRRQSRRSPSCEEGQHHQDDEQAPPTLHGVDGMVIDPKFRDVGGSRQLQYT